MAEYINIITQKGLELLTKIIQGQDEKQKLVFTKFQVGDGDIEKTDTPYKFESLKNPLKDVAISNYEIIGEGSVSIRCVISNKDIIQGFFMKEYALFALDPETNGEFLYIYSYTNHPDWFPAFTNTIAQSEFGIIATIGSTEKVAFIINKNFVYPTLQDFEDFKGKMEQTYKEKLDSGELKGDKGDTGATGIQGLKGDKGDTGQQGIQGIQGLKGDKGDTGAIGIQGLKGDKGDTGATGLQGLKGDKGDIGATGPQGLKGDKGDIGATGIQGLKGDKGDIGATGLQGLKGDKGDIGATGIQGLKGEDGDKISVGKTLQNAVERKIFFKVVD